MNLSSIATSQYFLQHLKTCNDDKERIDAGNEEYQASEHQQKRMYSDLLVASTDFCRDMTTFIFEAAIRYSCALHFNS
jgi:hypothetical protein